MNLLESRKDENQSVYWHQQAADNKNTSANIYLAKCYRLAFECYKKSAKHFDDEKNGEGVYADELLKANR
ncbi:hypothetical protein RhiirA1_465877 [Rhizophagus irregularis]|uniref:Uncharacterized protein n=2 Tax=Rhizophagus irregularis TaxID=588596 RepID=A0A2I1EU96_9GLOM|nr:hypothetical protein GLOIN_2v1790015 [Rhizophagus irregularis DAOM 181602=DAOM 197198]PKC61888.1 hypothetical protein RhiirA1_465877 [Rhizophagus irregularis]PKY25690.1 hypothetical protein RhiirB3_440731 [Rhizophagus irregularis]POG58710.1 hypothetical protein GLOIN_2v1790015 [Rhizophagus irregularis DAOM 181602=DAOM 197198]|eukprot:XP_025165576.1 hypothetical protein GLOIN_2v1790015 [Rhizophagus irregularis DAOM 181602=DAOM 197198]